MLLTLGLVVMVIFLFLRNVSATIIPSLALPFSIIGTFAVMYLLNYSLDNLSMMALILSIGFVVDDAIVMLENIVRHIEMGETAARGVAQGFGRDRLHHRLDDAVAGRGIHPGAVHGRRAGPAVQGIRRHHLRRDPDLGRGFGHADAHAVQPVPAVRARREARLVLPRHRAVLRRHAARSTTGRCRWVLRFRLATMAVFVPGAGGTAVPVRQDSQGLHSRPGHRPVAGVHGGRAGHFLLPDGGVPAADRRGGGAGPERGFADGERRRDHGVDPGRPELRRDWWCT